MGVKATLVKTLERERVYVPSHQSTKWQGPNDKEKPPRGGGGAERGGAGARVLKLLTLGPPYIKKFRKKEP